MGWCKKEVKENKVLSYCEALGYMWNNKRQQKSYFGLCEVYKPTVI